VQAGPQVYSLLEIARIGASAAGCGGTLRPNSASAAYAALLETEEATCRPYAGWSRFVLQVALSGTPSSRCRADEPLPGMDGCQSGQGVAMHGV